MITARLNSRGDIAAPGAASILGRSIQLRDAGEFRFDAAGFLRRGETLDAHTIDCTDGLSIAESATALQTIALTFKGEGRAKVSFSTSMGRSWDGQVSIGV